MATSISRDFLFIEPNGGFGGGQAVLLDLIRITQKQGFQVGVLFPFGGRLESELRTFKDLEVFPLKSFQFTSGRKKWIDVLKLGISCLMYFRHWSTFKSSKIIYVNGGRSFVQLAIVGLILRRNRFIIYHLHLDHSPLEKKIMRWISHRSATRLIVANSHFVFHKMQNGMFLERTALLQNCLPQAYQPPHFDDRFTGQCLNRFAIFGRVVPEKGHDLFLALARIFSDFDFYVFGDQAFDSVQYFERLQRAAPRNVFFKGAYESVSSAAKEFSIQVAVVPSQWEEPFGLVAIECMSASCLTLVRATGGLIEISEATGAIQFTELGELVSIVNDLRKCSSEDLVRVAQSQHKRVQIAFDPAMYEKNFLNLVAGG